MRAYLLPLLAWTTLAALTGCTKHTPTSEQAPAKQPPANKPAAEQPVYSQAPTDRPAAGKAATPAAPAATAKLDEAKYDHFGAGIPATTKATPLADVVKNPDAFTGKPVAIEAPIADVCPKKGCWMKLGTPTPALDVTFKDYAFFVPLDATGRTAIVEGVLTKESDKLKLKASGVAITKPPAK